MTQAHSNVKERGKMMSKKAWIIISGLAVFAVLIILAVEVTSQPDFCSRCHEIAPAVESWRQYSHKEVSCMECHADPGPIGVIKRKAGAYKELYVHFFGEVPREMEANVNYENCLICHSGKRESKYPQAPNITSGNERRGQVHKTILADETPCLNCHRETAHGNKGNDSF